MKKGKVEEFMLPNRLTLLQIFMVVMLLYLLFMSFKIPFAFRGGLGSENGAFRFLTDALPMPMPVLLEKPQEKLQIKKPRGSKLQKVSTLTFNESFFEDFELHKVARHAWVVGKKLWGEVESGKVESFSKFKVENWSDSCPISVLISRLEFRERFKGMMVLPCGLTFLSHVTVVGIPRWAHTERDPKIAVVKDGKEAVMVSQFMMELQGLKAVDKEEPPRILHFKPRFKGD